MALCKLCGKEVKDPSRRKFCSQICCRKFHTTYRSKKTVKLCAICGLEITGNSRIYCSDECRKKANSKKQIEYNKKLFKSVACKKQDSRGKRKPKMSLAKINKLARAAGLTYGEFVARNHLY